MTYFAQVSVSKSLVSRPLRKYPFDILTNDRTSFVTVMQSSQELVISGLVMANPGDNRQCNRLRFEIPGGS